MNKEVLISFKGTQNNGEERDKIELYTEGKFYKKGDHYYISYAESELTGMEGTTTTLKVDKKSNIIICMCIMQIMIYGKPTKIIMTLLDIKANII